MKKKTIAIGISPNTQLDDVFLALKILTEISSYQKGNYIQKLSQWFSHYFSVRFAVPFQSGRAGLFAILKAAGIEEGDEVIVPAFTCVVVPDAIIQAKGKPVYVDITDALTVDFSDIKRKISKNTKAIILQHTFAIASFVPELKTLAKKHNILLIEDCAHTIGATYSNKKIGTLGDVAFFSFGRDKAFSSVFGGMVITNEQMLGEKLRVFEKHLRFPSRFWVIQQLFHPIFFTLLLPLYRFKLTRALIVFLQKIHFLSLPVSKKEKQADKNALEIKKFPNALCRLALHQLGKIEQYNKKRQIFADLYVQELQGLQKVKLPQKLSLPYLRFPLLCDNSKELQDFLRKKGIYVGRWYANIIDPLGSNKEQAGYRFGSCPNAEYIAKHILNLPVYPTLNNIDVQLVIQAIIEYEKN